MPDAWLGALADAVLAACRARGLHLATAESCTGGMIAAALTDIAGSSDVVERGFVTYSNAAKSELLGVPPDLIAAHGAVSAEVALVMAQGALDRSPASQTRRGGRPNEARNSDFTCVSGNWSARVPTG